MNRFFVVALVLGVAATLLEVPVAALRTPIDGEAPLPANQGRSFVALPYFGVNNEIANESATSSCSYPNWCYAWSFYTANEAGVQANLLVTNPTPVSGSVVANFVDINFADGTWIQAGWAKGVTNGGNTGSSVRFYVEYCTNSFYCAPGHSQYYFALLGTATPGTTHTFLVERDIHTAAWSAVIDGTWYTTATFSSMWGTPTVQVESHNAADYMPVGDCSNLMFVVMGIRGPRLIAWDGYGSTGANPPLTRTILSTTHWTYSEN